MYAFRCKNCGHLHTSDDAGEANHPHACRVCGKGVVHGYDPLQLHKDILACKTPEDAKKLTEAIARSATDKKIVPDNWECLHDATDARLKELGLERSHVKKHVAAKGPTIPNIPKSVFAQGVEVATAKDRAS